jgi:phosphotransferase system  glucose/maltose/N-acetylglucosamine-specific IIC component
MVYSSLIFYFLQRWFILFKYLPFIINERHSMVIFWTFEFFWHYFNNTKKLRSQRHQKETVKSKGDKNENLLSESY